ncbi:hypothetical protein OO013_16735 [Mangrovivirga sp. M17]|uniref:Outer membrane protein beta-barrel domain-containing protein n=1 Tax=Mangrovivirga halotolerans TaxID=2993936 RepID=A0ABT3RUT1_9BACT|nr:hypothetical protein [Mangrovivirga halotolerans]MCX2745529.1 hypothetical protein [Mangrovivirga halotolerans]
MFKELLIILILFAVSSNLIYCQNTINKYAFSPKYGSYYGNSTTGFGGGIEFNLTLKKTMLSIDYYHFKEFIILGDSPDEYFNQVGIMGGTYFGENFFRFQLQGGFATMWGVKREDSYISRGLLGGTTTYDNFSTVGFVMKTGFKLNPVNFFGFGLDFQVNINSYYTAFMVLFALEFGKIRTVNKLEKFDF